MFGQISGQHLPWREPQPAPAAPVQAFAASIVEHGFAVIPLDADTQRVARAARQQVAPYLEIGARQEHFSACFAREPPEPPN